MQDLEQLVQHFIDLQKPPDEIYKDLRPFIARTYFKNGCPS
jgi:hypothetical protein